MQYFGLVALKRKWEWLEIFDTAISELHAQTAIPTYRYFKHYKTSI